MAGFMLGWSATSSLSGKNLSNYDKGKLVGAERWDPPRENHKATFVSPHRACPQEFQAVGADRAVWKCLWEALRNWEVFAWDRASQKWGLEFLAGAGISVCKQEVGWGQALRRSLSKGTGRALAPPGWNKPILTQLLALCPFDTMPGVFLHGAAAGLHHVRAQHGAINGF